MNAHSMYWEQHGSHPRFNSHYSGGHMMQQQTPPPAQMMPRPSFGGYSQGYQQESNVPSYYSSHLQQPPYPTYNKTYPIHHAVTTYSSEQSPSIPPVKMQHRHVPERDYRGYNYQNDVAQMPPNHDPRYAHYTQREEFSSEEESMRRNDLGTDSSSEDGQPENHDSSTSVVVRDGRWRPDEHDRFLKGYEKFGNQWRKVQEVVGTRTVTQVRTHAQKHLLKLQRHMMREKNGKRKPDGPLGQEQTIPEGIHNDVLHDINALKKKKLSLPAGVKTLEDDREENEQIIKGLKPILLKSILAPEVLTKSDAELEILAARALCKLGNVAEQASILDASRRNTFLPHMKHEEDSLVKIQS